MPRPTRKGPPLGSFEIDGRDYVVLQALGADVLDEASAGAVIDAVLTDPEGRLDLAGWLGVHERELDDPAVRARAVDELAGRLLALELDDVWDGNGTEVGPKLDPIEPTDPVKPPRQRPTWIAIEVVDEFGGGFPGTSWRITLPDGEERMLRLDAGSRWRADDVREAGSAHLRATALLEPPAGTGQPSSDASAEEVWVGPEADIPTMLATGREHRVVVVRGCTEIVLLDDAQAPVPSARCEARFDLSLIRGRTDAQGTFMVWHPRRTTELEVRFPDLDGGTWHVLRTEPLERSQEA